MSLEQVSGKKDYRKSSVKDTGGGTSTEGFGCTGISEGSLLGRDLDMECSPVRSRRGKDGLHAYNTALIGRVGSSRHIWRPISHLGTRMAKALEVVKAVICLHASGRLTRSNFKTGGPRLTAYHSELCKTSLGSRYTIHNNIKKKTLCK